MILKKSLLAESPQKPLPIISLPETGLLAVRHFVSIPGIQIGAIPVAQSTWLKWVADGLAPKPIKLGKRVTVWRAEDLREFAEKLSLGTSNGGVTNEK